MTTKTKRLQNIPSIDEYVKQHPKFQNSLLYQMGQKHKGNNNYSHINNPSMQNHWYPIASSKQLPMDGNNKVFIQLFGEPIILYRSLPDGKVVAAQDRCPHRSAPLSMGIAKKGELQCRYHDWKFGQNGKATNIPCASKGFIDKVNLFTIPCQEKNGYIYIYHGEVDETDEKSIPNFVCEDNNLIHESLTDYYEEFIGDLDGIWFHHLENLVDFAHTYFIHKNRAPFQFDKYEKSAPFLCKQFYDKRGFILLVEKANKELTVIRFDPPMSWYVEVLNVNGTSKGIFNVAHFIPINKNHTRVIFRGYMKLYKTLRWIPFFKYISDLESYRILNEDNSLIAGQSIRTDYLGAPIAYKSRAEDLNIALIYKFYGCAIKNDNNNIWFKTWNCSDKGAICSNYGTDKVFKVVDIEDILSEPMVISTPWGDLSATAVMKTYPPANKEAMEKLEKQMTTVKWTSVATASVITAVIGYIFYKRKS